MTKVISKETVNDDIRKQTLAILDALQILMEAPTVHSPALEITPAKVSIKITDPAIQAWIKIMLIKHNREEG